MSHMSHLRIHYSCAVFCVYYFDKKKVTSCSTVSIPQPLEHTFLSRFASMGCAVSGNMNTRVAPDCGMLGGDVMSPGHVSFSTP